MKVCGQEGGSTIYVTNVTAQLRQDLEGGRVVVGTMFREIQRLKQMDDPLMLAKELGYRFVVIDHEHKAFDEQTLADYADKAHQIGISIWIRPAQLSEVPISRYADIGYSGFMVPNAIERLRIRRIIDQAYFHPIADRSAHIRRGYSMGPVILDGQRLDNVRAEEAYANSNMIVALQTEHQDGIKNLKELISMDGIVGTIIGPNDLAINLSRLEGKPDLTELKKDEMYEDEVIMNAYQTIGKIARDNRKVAGVHFNEKNQMRLVEKLVADMGYRLILLGTEANFHESYIRKTKETIENI